MKDTLLKFKGLNRRQPSEMEVIEGIRQKAAENGSSNGAVVVASPSVTTPVSPLNEDLVKRVSELEEQLAKALAQPDLSKLAEDDLNVMASETARTILQVARTQSAAAAEQAEQLIQEAKAEVSRLLEEAKQGAGELRDKAEKEVQAARVSLQSEISAKLDDAATESEALLEKTKIECKELIASALKRREVMYEELEHQRRVVMATLDEASHIQELFTTGYLQLRKAIDESVTHLIEPVKMARRQIEHIDRELQDRHLTDAMHPLNAPEETE